MKKKKKKIMRVPGIMGVKIAGGGIIEPCPKCGRPLKRVDPLEFGITNMERKTLYQCKNPKCPYNEKLLSQQSMIDI